MDRDTFVSAKNQDLWGKTGRRASISRSSYSLYVCSEEHSGQTSGMCKWVHILAAARQFPAQKFEGKHGKQPVSRKIYEKKLKSS